MSGIDAHLLDHVWNDAVILVDESDEQMFRLNLGMTRLLSQLLRCKKGLLRLFRHLFQVHLTSLTRRSPWRWYPSFVCSRWSSHQE